MEFKTVDEGSRFYFDVEDESKGYVQIRLSTPADIEEIERATTKKRTEYKKGGRFEFIDRNEKLYFELIYDKSIVGWDNVYIDGELAECTKDNKIKLMKNSNQFASFITDCIETLAADTKIDDEDAVKN